MTDLSNRMKNFMDTAAILKNLDLVITIDTAIAHCAGAMGLPVWVALPVAPDWRWLMSGEKSMWYPTMRLFRQTRLGQWEDVFQRMAEEVEKLVLECLEQCTGVDAPALPWITRPGHSLLIALNEELV